MQDRRAPFDYTGLRKVAALGRLETGDRPQHAGATVFARTARRLEGCES